ncbi:hypothetical protein DL95DRAFT_385902, partial [Leptodontidium sp. 2 PMI_412]
MKTITIHTSLPTSVVAQTAHNMPSFTVKTRTHSASLICKPDQRCVEINPEIAPTTSLVQSQLPQPTSPNPTSSSSVYWAGFSLASTEEGPFTATAQSLSSSSVVKSITSALLTTETRTGMGSTSSTDSIVSIEIIPSRHRTFTSTTSLASVDIIPVAGAV